MNFPTDKEIADVLRNVVLPDGTALTVPVSLYGTISGTWTLAALFDMDALAHTGLTIRQPRRAHGLGVETLIVEVDYQKHRNRINYFFQTRVDLSAPGWPSRLTAAIARAYEQLPKRHSEKLVHANRRRE